MSLINDALKRASETKKQTGDPPPPVTLSPVDYAIRPNPAFRFLVVLLLLTALAFALWFLSKWQEHSAFSSKLEAVTNTRPAEIVASTLSPPPQAGGKPRIKVSTNLVIRDLPNSKPATALVATEPAETSRTPESTAGVVETATNAVAAAVRPAEPDDATNSFPKLKLQSIVYRLSKPAVVINGEMLYAGDTVKEARILKIERFAVTLEWHGQTNVLSLPRL